MQTSSFFTLDLFLLLDVSIIILYRVCKKKLPPLKNREPFGVRKIPKHVFLYFQGEPILRGFQFFGYIRGGPRGINFKILNGNPLLVIHHIKGLKKRSTLVQV
jgi:hypothetical protein